MASVELRAIRKSFGDVDIIHGIDLSIADKEFVALVGPSGCGKSTLLRMIAGLEEASAGDILIGNEVVNDRSPRDRNIAMVFQSYALYPHMTVAENMGLNLKLSRKPKAEIKARVSDAARMLGLEQLLDRRPSELSGGQRQRVAMGRAIVRNPSVFLFDEPLSNLDAKLRVQMRSEIKALHQKVSTTAIYVTHDQIEAMTLADRIVVLNGGRIEQQGTPLELYKRPANLFVAGFIGSPSMNFLSAVAQADGEHRWAQLPSGTLVDLPAGIAVTTGQRLTLGVRPEHLVRNGPGSSISGTMMFAEPTGAQTHVFFEAEDRELVTVVDAGEEPVVGQPFGVSVKPEVVHVFDAATGVRVTAK